MKPDWDKLISEYKDSKTALVADVDCTAAGESLCQEVGVQGYPTLKWGDPSSLEDYEGGRDLDELRKFAKENLKPQCSPANIDLCDAEKKAEIEKFQAMSDAALDGAIKEKTDALAKIEQDFESFVEGLQKQYEEANEKKDKDTAEIKRSGLSIMKAVKANRGKASNEEL